jgi:formate/nitrite transporter FocA (FNT family)
MNPKREKFYRALFLVAAVYDVVLGIVFTFFYRSAFGILGIADKLPESGAYLSLIGAFLFVIGVAYYLIYRGDLLRNRDLVTVGALYKLAYCLIAFVYAAIGQVPHMIFVFLFGGCDLIFFILMIECRLYLQKIGKQA